MGSLSNQGIMTQLYIIILFFFHIESTDGDDQKVNPQRPQSKDGRVCATTGEGAGGGLGHGPR